MKLWEQWNLWINQCKQASDKQQKVGENSREGVMFEGLLQESLLGKQVFVNKQQITNLYAIIEIHNNFKAIIVRKYF